METGRGLGKTDQSRMSLSHEKQSLCDVIITAVHHGYCKVVKEAVKKSSKFEEEYNRFPPSPGDLLDFGHILVMIWLEFNIC